MRADESSADGQANDFVDFVRNVGQPPDKRFGGGTYGYGKSVFYLASQASSIVVFTRCSWQGGPENRLIAAALGEAFKDGRGSRLRPYTGRHWWGRLKADEIIDPLLGRGAEDLAAKIGLERRSLPGPGTSILIVQPRFAEDEDPPLAMARLARSITWNFWPKMLSHGERPAPMRFSVSWNGREMPVPGTQELFPLMHFANALKSIHSVRRGQASAVGSNVQEVRCERPKRLLGHLAITKYAAPQMRSPDAAAPFVEGHHVALLREPELVVRYLEGPAFADGLREWAGVFLADSDVDSAFAASEPPAHDDWVPKILERSPEKTMVNVALREISDAAKAVAGPQGAVRGDSDQPPLGALASRLGSMLLGIEGPGPGPGSGQSPRATGAGRTSRPLVQIIDEKLVVAAGDREARLTVRVTPDEGGTTLAAKADIVILDGGATEREPPQGSRVAQVRGWELDGRQHSGSRLTLTGTGPQEVILRVGVPEDAVVQIAVVAEQGIRAGLA